MTHVVGLRVLPEQLVVVCLSRLLHRPQRVRLNSRSEDVGADQPICVGRRLPVKPPLHQRSEHVGDQLVQRSRLIMVFETGSELGDAVGPRQGDERVELGRAVDAPVALRERGHVADAHEVSGAREVAGAIVRLQDGRVSIRVRVGQARGGEAANLKAMLDGYTPSTSPTPRSTQVVADRRENVDPALPLPARRGQ